MEAKDSSGWPHAPLTDWQGWVIGGSESVAGAMQKMSEIAEEIAIDAFELPDRYSLVRARYPDQAARIVLLSHLYALSLMNPERFEGEADLLHPGGAWVVYLSGGELQRDCLHQVGVTIHSPHYPGALLPVGATVQRGHPQQKQIQVFGNKVYLVPRSR